MPAQLMRLALARALRPCLPAARPGAKSRAVAVAPRQMQQALAPHAAALPLRVVKRLAVAVAQPLRVPRALLKRQALRLPGHADQSVGSPEQAVLALAQPCPPPLLAAGEPGLLAPAKRLHGRASAPAQANQLALRARAMHGLRHCCPCRRRLQRQPLAAPPRGTRPASGCLLKPAPPRARCLSPKGLRLAPDTPLPPGPFAGPALRQSARPASTLYAPCLCSGPVRFALPVCPQGYRARRAAPAWHSPRP